MGLLDGLTGWAYWMGLPDEPTGWAYRMGLPDGPVAGPPQQEKDGGQLDCREHGSELAIRAPHQLFDVLAAVQLTPTRF